jgi:CubicO group peptidase (beta-lactamase class C family)
MRYAHKEGATVMTRAKTPVADAAARAGFPPPESAGGWPVLTGDDVRRVGGMDPARLEALRRWLHEADDRPFAAVVVRRGCVVLEEARGRSAVDSCENVKSCAKAICATVLAIAAEASQCGETPHRLTFDDRAFDHLPWAHPLSDPRKATITVRQLLNHTSGITPERSGIKNQGPWEHILGHVEHDPAATLAFDPGTDLGYSTHAFYHASLVCEHVTGLPYDRYAIEALLQPLGIERWWFQEIEGDARHGTHPSHSLGLSARSLARIGYCLLRSGRWGARQVVPEWFVRETAHPTHAVRGIRDFGREAQTFSHAWELPGQQPPASPLGPVSAHDRPAIPPDARAKHGSGGQLVAFIPSLDLVVARQTGGSGPWAYDEYLRLAAAACLEPAETSAMRAPAG